MSMISSSLFPGTNEVLTYPAPRQVVALPASEVMPFVMKELDEQAARPFADYEIVTGLGQLARLMNVQNTEVEVDAWLQSNPTENACETAALFLSGFWPGQSSPSALLVERLVACLNQYGASVGFVETLIQALGPAAASNDAGVRDSIRPALSRLLPLYPLLQRSSQLLFRHAAGLGEHQLPKARPEFSDFKAYACTVDGEEYISIEHTDSHREVVRVRELTVSERVLTVEYEIRVITCTDVLARELLAHRVLLELCDDIYRKRVDQVRYTNAGRRTSTIVAYPPNHS